MPASARQRGAAARRRAAALVVAAFATVIVVVVAILLATGILHLDGNAQGPPFTGKLNAPQGGRHYRVTAWTTRDAPSLDTALAARAIDEVDFDWYLSQVDGSVVAAHENLDLVAAARTRGVQAFATVTNRPSDKDSFKAAIATAILATPESRARHVEALVRLAVEKGFDGVDLDWELVRPADRERFSAFVDELAAGLHGRDRLLSIAVFPKTSEPGRWDTQKPADYARLGDAVDEFKIMTYSFSGPWSAPGPQSPLDWASDVLTFAESLVPAKKIYMGIPFYGFDWHGDAASAVQYRDAAALLDRHGATVTRDAASREATFSYRDADGVDHVVFFQDREAIAAKLRLLTRDHEVIGGIAIWAMREEDPRFWKVIRSRLQGGGT